MNKYKITYWVTTGLFAAFMLFSAYSYLTSEEMKGAFTFLGFPDYFRIELAVAKLLGALVLILPFAPKSLKIIAYSGFFINIVSAVVAHLAKDYHAYGFIVFSAVTLALSYYAYMHLERQNVQPKTEI
ncbi:DoxX family protein [Pseudopedobacter beijingensis]|uniref:DoxX family protein n=1 Tax=Pseudopedobacter beijingensis TaxID=1207056 RepID=A0ABW4IDA5_9SPHI